MKKHFYLLFLLFLFISRVDAKEIYTYTEWLDYYPTDVEEYRIETEDRYYWYKENDDGSRDTTSELLSNMDGYTKIEESKKTFYRVNNGPLIIYDTDGNLVYDAMYCIKSVCNYKYVKEYIPNQGEVPISNNPKTGDNIIIYLIIFIVCSIIMQKNNLVLSNRFKVTN